MLSFGLLLGFLCVFELENIYIQSLLMLAHIAEDNGSGFIQVWFCATVSEEGHIMGGRQCLPSFGSSPRALYA